jgi:N-acetylated-alpha-linked acidic dipeptidase
LNVGGSHTLERFINEIANGIPDPETKLTIAQRWRAQKVARASLSDRKEIRARTDVRIEALGSGSDYTPFLQHLGIASLNVGYSGEEGGGCYHSIYDSFDHYVRFGDPDFQYGVVMVRTAGHIMLRLANAEILPYEFSDFTDTIANYIKEVAKLTDDLRDATAETNRLITDRVLIAVADPSKPYVEPKTKAEVPYLNFAPLQNALASLRRSSDNFESSRLRMANGVSAPLSEQEELALDNALLQSERFLILPEGLPRRPWYQHLIYAPGFYTGYGVKTLPGVREAIEQRNWKEAAEQIEIAGAAIVKYASELDRCAELMKSAH